MAMALDGIRIFDLTRVLAGPTCTQVLADLGADVIKIERTGTGDDTRGWGPPYLMDDQGAETSEAAYFISTNRNKRSVTLDIGSPEGQAIAKRLIAQSDVLVENFKTGNLAKYGLDYESLSKEFPWLVYCSVTGFGQTGPYAPRAGYDFLAQGMGGIMSLTGATDGDPMKVGIGIADMMTGMYAAVAILAALRHRERTGEGQHIDMALLDTQVSWLSYEAENFLISGKIPHRWANAHPNIVPYEVFPTADGYFILAAGNDRQFKAFCGVAGRPEVAEDARFAKNDGRLRNRAALIPIIREITSAQSSAFWLRELEKVQVPCGPVNNLQQAFDDPQVKARNMRIEMDHPLGAGGKVPLVASPIKMSKTPPAYRHAPPTLGQHTDEVLRESLGMEAEEIARLRAAGIL